MTITSIIGQLEADTRELAELDKLSEQVKVREDMKAKAKTIKEKQEKILKAKKATGELMDALEGFFNEARAIKKGSDDIKNMVKKVEDNSIIWNSDDPTVSYMDEGVRSYDDDLRPAKLFAGIIEGEFKVCKMDTFRIMNECTSRKEKRKTVLACFFPENIGKVTKMHCVEHEALNAVINHSNKMKDAINDHRMKIKNVLQEMAKQKSNAIAKKTDEIAKATERVGIRSSK